MKLVLFDFSGTIDTNKKFDQKFLPIFSRLSKSYKLGIISRAPSLLIKEYLESANSIDFFSDIIGYETTGAKAEKIKDLLEKYKILSEDTVFVTDTVSDILEAKKSHVKSIAVTWGFRDEKTLQEANPEKIVNNPEDLVKTIEEVLK